MGPGNKQDPKWRRVSLATLTPAGSGSGSTSSRYSLLQWYDDKDDHGRNRNSKNITTKLVLVKVHPIIHVVEQEKQKKGGWLSSLSFASSSASFLPRTYFSVDALDAQAFEKALQYGSTPAPPKVYLLGFNSLVDARTWQEAATSTKASAATPAPVQAPAASKRDQGGTKHLDAEDKAVAGMGLRTDLLASAGVQGKGQVAVDASGADVPAPPAPAVVKQATPSHYLPCIDFPSAPTFRTAASTPSSSSSSSSSFTTSTKSLEERLHALHHAEQVHRLAALRNLEGAPVDEAILQARHAALTGGEKKGRGSVEVGRERRGGGGDRGHAFVEAVTARLNEDEMVEELLAQVSENMRLEGREGGVEEVVEEGDVDVGYTLAAVTTSAREEGGTDGEDHRKALSSTPSVPSEAVLQNLLQEARALEATSRRPPSYPAAAAGAEAGGGVAVPMPPAKGGKMGKKQQERDVEEEYEDGSVLARCAATLRAVTKGTPERERGQEGEEKLWGKDEEEEEEDVEEKIQGVDEEIDEKGRTEVAAVMELAYLWAKEGRTDGEREGENST